MTGILDDFKGDTFIDISHVYENINESCIYLIIHVSSEKKNTSFKRFKNPLLNSLSFELLHIIFYETTMIKPINFL